MNVSRIKSFKIATEFGAGLIKLGLKSNTDSEPNFDSLLAIFLKNDPKWIFADVGCVLFNIVTIPLHDSLDMESIIFIINQTQLTTILISDSHLEFILKIQKSCPSLKNVIINDEIPDSKIPIDSQLQFYKFSEVVILGRENPIEYVPPKSNDVFTICYTSGTTGDPKGVMLEHGNLLASGRSLLATIPTTHRLNQTDSHLSFLPISHIFERTIVHALAYLGAEICFYNGDHNLLQKDLIMFKPTFLPVVPRVLTKLHARILSKVSELSAFRRFVFNHALEYKLKLLNEGIVTKTTFWDYLVFSKVRQLMGGRINLMVTGSAPTDPKLLSFFRAILGCEILEGYGQTEACASGTVTRIGDYQYPYGCHVGPPVYGVELKLIDHPELNYQSTDIPNPRGEICLRGANIMRGYFKNPKKTSSTIDSQKWLHTGDIGEIQPNGTLKIIDRVNNVIKLSQGEFVSLEKIESKIENECMEQCIVFGNSLHSFIVAIVKPNFNNLLLKEWKSLGEHQEMSQDLELRNFLISKISIVGKKNGLHGFEIPKKIFMTKELMTVENGMLTSTFKMKREKVMNAYKNEIEARLFSSTDKMTLKEVQTVQEEIIKETYEEISLATDITQKLVYQYLIHNCYSETAYSLGKAMHVEPPPNKNIDIQGDYIMDDVYSSEALGGLSGIPRATFLESLNAPLSTLEARKHIFKLIINGSLKQAIVFFKSTFAGMFENTTDILFMLHCQEFIECIKISCMDALLYAQNELKQYGQIPKYNEELSDLLSLMAYQDPHTSPVKHYLSVSRRENVAQKLNGYILASNGIPEISTLEIILKHLSVLREQVHHESKQEKSKVVYPAWDMNEFMEL